MNGINRIADRASSDLFPPARTQAKLDVAAGRVVFAAVLAGN
jgi:hypothetical protein